MSAPASDVAALYVDRNGPYPSRVLDWYDDRRDARTYAAELPVVAHPPCQRNMWRFTRRGRCQLP